ncbi:MAG: transposase [Eubacteriales bacterium]|jgi:putative transposase
MARVKYSPEQIIIKPREVEVLCGIGSSIAEAARQIGVTEQTYYRWRREYGNMDTQQAKLSYPH